MIQDQELQAIGCNKVPWVDNIFHVTNIKMEFHIINFNSNVGTNINPNFAVVQSRVARRQNGNDSSL